jgi:GH15 family glucan-1,4-alpha-glucosidase
MSARPPLLADLAPIGDRRTSALVGRDAAIRWYTPHRFDGPALLLGLLDEAKGGWRIELAECRPGARRYMGDSAVLETQLHGGGGSLTVTDWMNLGREVRPGALCRSFSRAPSDIRVVFEGWRDWGRSRAFPQLVGDAAVFDDGMHLFASHPLHRQGNGAVCWTLPRGEQGWAVLSDGPGERPKREDLESWRETTIARWAELARRTAYEGPYDREVTDSLRQLRLLVFEPTGAVAGAATAGLPEVLGGKRNYDYRYCWLRDTAMVVRAMLRAAPAGQEGEAFLRFVAQAREHARHPPLDIMSAVDGRPVPAQSTPPLPGYADSHPVRIANRARNQLQLGAYGGFLLAAASVFRAHGERDHWPLVREVADFLVRNWQRSDSGVWESSEPRQYTASKVFVVCGLEAILPFAGPRERRLYGKTAQVIREHVFRHHLTTEGAFATFAGTNGVDVTSALFPVWSFCPPDCPQMIASVRVLERNYLRDGLLRRDDRTPQSELEGAFLPATFWLAQYWSVRNDAERARSYIEAGLRHANDVGVLPEEVEWQGGRALGNLPLGMTHASLVNAVVDLAECEERATRSRAHPGQHPPVLRVAH